MSELEAVNPSFFNANLVFMHYCDGSSYSSYREEPLTAPAGLPAALAAIAAERGSDWNSYNGKPAGAPPKQIWMRGRANLKAVVSYMLQYLGLADSTEFIVSGGSAGATGVFLGLDYIRSWVPPTLRVAGNPDAGMFLDLARAGGNDTWYRDCFEAAAPVWNGSDLASAACGAAYASQPWHCYLPEYSAQYIATPMLVSNSAIDMWGTLNILGLGCEPSMDNKTSAGGLHPCAPPQWELLQGWADAFHARLGAWLSGSPQSRTAFIPSCWDHEINIGYCSGQSLPNCRGWATYFVAPSSGSGVGGPSVTLQTATTQWFQALFASGSSYQAALQAGLAAVAAALAGQPAPQQGAALTQWVDAFTYPMNPSCVYPPG